MRYAILAVAAASLCILLYLWWAFSKVTHPVRYGATAIVALLHDALVVLGIFSILGRLFPAEIELESTFIVAVLTVIGFSVHDTIVVFDRIRENFIRRAGEPFEDVVNHSLAQTLTRSLNTSLTVILTLVVLMLFGGVDDPHLRAGAADRHHHRDVLVDLRRQHAAGELAHRRAALAVAVPPPRLSLAGCAA